jgi:hypothetical protein
LCRRTSGHRHQPHHPPLAASGLTISIGDAASNAPCQRFDRGVAGGTVIAFAAGGYYYNYTANTEILITFTGAVTPAAGTITNFLLEGFIGP